MTRPNLILLASGILFLLSLWSLVLGGLAVGGQYGGGDPVATVPEELAGVPELQEAYEQVAARQAPILRRAQLVGAMGSVLNATILILAGIGLLSLAMWSRFLGLVLGFWTVLGGMVAGIGGFGLLRMGGFVTLFLGLLLIGTLFSGSVRTALSPPEPLPRGVITLGVLYFCQGVIVSPMATVILGFSPRLPIWVSFVGFLFIVLWVAILLLLGIGLLKLQRWARLWTLVAAWATAGLLAVGWVLLLTRDPSGDAVGIYIVQNILWLPVSVFALVHLTRPRVKELFVGAA